MAALQLVLDVHSRSAAGETDTRVRELLCDADRRGLSLDLLFGIYDGEALRTALLAVESPGRAALVLMPESAERATATADLAACLGALRDAAFARSNLLLEMLLRPGSPVFEEAVDRAGWWFLTELIYLRRRGKPPKPRDAIPAKVTWRIYSAETQPFFEEAISRSYTQSMDCPELTDLRPIADVIAGHRAAGEFDPQFWSVAIGDSGPAGVLLMSRVAGQNAFEIVYMGVAAGPRRTGIGHALMSRAVEIASSSASELTPPAELVLAVDARNVPARRLYARWGFAEFEKRRAWIATPPQIRG